MDKETVELVVIDLLQKGQNIDRLTLTKSKFEMGACTQSIPGSCFMTFQLELESVAQIFKYELSGWNGTYGVYLSSITSRHKTCQTEPFFLP